MYLNSLKKNFYHGIMFHHFHDNKKYLKTPGSINKQQFRQILEFIGKKNILSPSEFIKKIKNKTIKKNHLCLTFDDSLKCQYDIALPVLTDLKIKAFFFIYTNSLTNNPDLLEVNKYFRYKYFKNINTFYNEFNQLLEKKFKKKVILNFFQTHKEEMIKWKDKFKIYSKNDIKFRFVRDKLLTRAQYKEIMMKMYNKKKFNYKKKIKELSMNKKNIITLHKLGHEIGLHSHTHPTKLSLLSVDEQYYEYKTNSNYLKKLLKISQIRSMSHPNGSYTEKTLKILKKLNVEIGFKQTLMPDKNKKINNSVYEIARNDHAKINRLI